MKYLWLVCVAVTLVGCKKENNSALPPDQPSVPSKPTGDAVAPNPIVQPVDSPELVRTKAKLASYADFVKATKQLNMRLGTGITHEELDQKSRTVVDAYALIDDPSSPLMDKATTVIHQLKLTQSFWHDQDQVGVGDPKAVPAFLSEISKAINGFQDAYGAAMTAEK